jgi:outer membrane protein assembly factor BamE
MRKALLLVLATVLLGGCNFIYRAPVYQGNLLEKKYVEQLQVGMSRAQVKTLLGTPPVADPFHNDRWDYVASERYGHKSTQVKDLTIWFTGDVVSKWEGEYFPDHNDALRAQAAKFGNLPRETEKEKAKKRR